jgi:crossover junction endodeoxyribonuclease RuvC
MGYGVIKCQGQKAEMIAMGVIDMRKESDTYLKLGHIFERVTGIIDEYLPDELVNERIWHGQHSPAEEKLVERMKNYWGKRFEK